MASAELERFRLKVREYRLLANRNQSDLAAYLNLDYNELSNRLNAHKNARLSHENVRAIVRALAEWKAITTQAQAIELLDMMLCPHFDVVDWQAHPLSKLVTTSTPAVSDQNQPVVAPSSWPKPPTSALRPSAPNHNLPQALSSFIGRQAEIITLKKRLVEDRVRLLTLVGAGGCGKTRLSMQVGAELLDSFQEGVWLVELAPLTDPTLIAQTIATTLGLSEQAGRPILATLSDYLRSCQLLLILDNCEHLVVECARVVETLIQSSSRLQILASSRQALRISGERIFRVPSLSLPDLHRIPLPEALADYEAVRLFTERTLAVSPDFAISEQNAPSVVKLCNQLDGIPLAIELAAARTTVLTVEQIAARLDDRFRLLTGGSRTALPRQQTLRALVDWSYELLSGTEKRLLAHLSVFAGGWTLNAAEAVCGGEGLTEYDILEALTGLVNKSLVQVEEAANSVERRYYLLETIRQYGLEKLKAAGEETAVRERHLTYHVTFVRELNPDLSLRANEQLVTLKRLDRELDNLRKALDTGLAFGRAEMVLELVFQLGYYWDIRCYFSEGLRYLEQVISLATGGIGRAKAAFAIFRAGWFAMRQGDTQAAQPYVEEALALSKGHPDKEFAAVAFTAMASLHYGRGNYAEARYYYEQVVLVTKELNHPFFKSAAQSNLSLALMAMGDYEQASRVLDEVLVIQRVLGNQWALTITHNQRGILALSQGDYKAARSAFEEALSIGEKIDFPNHKLTTLSWLAIIAYNQDEFEKSRRYLEEGLTTGFRGGQRFDPLLVLVGVMGLLSKSRTQGRPEELLEQITCLGGAISALAASLQQVLRPPSPRYYEQALEVARSGLDEATFEAAFARGQAMSLEEVIHYARQVLAAS